MFLFDNGLTKPVLGVKMSILRFAVHSGEIRSLPCISVPFQALPVFCFKP